MVRSFYIWFNPSTGEATLSQDVTPPPTNPSLLMVSESTYKSMYPSLYSSYGLSSYTILTPPSSSYTYTPSTTPSTPPSTATSTSTSVTSAKSTTQSSEEIEGKKITSYSRLTQLLIQKYGYRKVRKMGKEERIAAARSMGYNYQPRVAMATDVNTFLPSNKGVTFNLDTKSVVLPKRYENPNIRPTEGSPYFETYYKGREQEAYLSPREAKRLREGSISPTGSYAIVGGEYVLASPETMGSTVEFTVGKAEEKYQRATFMMYWGQKKKSLQREQMLVYSAQQQRYFTGGAMPSLAVQGKPVPSLRVASTLPMSDYYGYTPSKTEPIILFTPAIGRAYETESLVSPQVMANMPEQAPVMKSKTDVWNFLKGGYYYENKALGKVTQKIMPERLMFGKEPLFSKQEGFKQIERVSTILPKGRVRDFYVNYEKTKVERMFGAGREVYTTVRNKPLDVVVLMGSGYLFGAVGSGISKVGTWVMSKGLTKTGMLFTTAPKGIGYGLGTMYFGVRGYEYVTSPTAFGSGRVLGKTALETTAFLGGTRIYQKGVTLRQERLFREQTFIVERGTEPIKTEKIVTVERPLEAEIGKSQIRINAGFDTSKQLLTKATVRESPIKIYEFGGIKSGKPFRQLVVQVGRGEFAPQYSIAKEGKFTILSESKFSTAGSISKTKVLAGNYVVKNTLLKGTNVEPITFRSKSYTEQPQDFEVYEDSGFGMRTRATRSKVTQVASRNIDYFGSGGKKIGYFEQKIGYRTMQRVRSVFISRPTYRITRNYLVSSDIEGGFKGSWSKEKLGLDVRGTRIKFGSEFKSPEDITITKNIRNFVNEANEPTTEYEVMQQRGGQLRGHTDVTRKTEFRYEFIGRSLPKEKIKMPSLSKMFQSKKGSFTTFESSKTSETITGEKSKVERDFVINPRVFESPIDIGLEPRLNSDILNVHGTKFGMGFTSRTVFGGIKTSMYKGTTAVKFNTKIETMKAVPPITETRPIVTTQPITKVKPIITTKTQVITKTRTQTIQRTSVTGIGTTSKVPPNIPIPYVPPPPPPFIPAWNFGLKEQIGTSKIKYGKTRKKYIPSLAAMTFGIYGSKPIGKLTGLELRPLLRGRKNARRKKSKR